MSQHQPRCRPSQGVVVTTSGHSCCRVWSSLLAVRLTHICSRGTREGLHTDLWLVSPASEGQKCWLGELRPARLTAAGGDCGSAALVPSPGQEGQATSVRPQGKQILLLRCLTVFWQKGSVPYPLHRSVYLHHPEPRGWSFFWLKLKVLGSWCLQVAGKQVSPLTIFTALWLYKLHTGPLVPAVKVKRHEIKSDPTPLGFEGRSISILHENLVWYYSLNSHLITAGGWHWSSLGGWGQFTCTTGIKTACYCLACRLHSCSPSHGPELNPQFPACFGK